MTGMAVDDFYYSHIARLPNFMSFTKKCIVLKTFIESQFGYCSLISMFHDGHVNNKINHLHERSRSIVFKDNLHLFANYKLFTIHLRKIPY